MKVTQTMSRQVICANPDQSLREAWGVMQEKGYRHVPVVEDMRLVGILSDRDVLLAAGTADDGHVQVPDVPVEQAMSRHPITGRENSSIADVARVMIDRKIDALPILDTRAKLVGLVTSSDLMELLCEDDTLGQESLPFQFDVKELNRSASLQ